MFNIRPVLCFYLILYHIFNSLFIIDSKNSKNKCKELKYDFKGIGIAIQKMVRISIHLMNETVKKKKILRLIRAQHKLLTEYIQWWTSQVFPPLNQVSGRIIVNFLLPFSFIYALIHKISNKVIRFNFQPIIAN